MFPVNEHPFGGVEQSPCPLSLDPHANRNTDGRQISKYTFDPFSYEQASINVSSE
jgi:hypothetical protein